MRVDGDGRFAPALLARSPDVPSLARDEPQVLYDEFVPAQIGDRVVLIEITPDEWRLRGVLWVDRQRRAVGVPAPIVDVLRVAEVSDVRALVILEHAEV